MDSTRRIIKGGPRISNVYVEEPVRVSGQRPESHTEHAHSVVRAPEPGTARGRPSLRPGTHQIDDGSWLMPHNVGLVIETANSLQTSDYTLAATT